MRTMRPTLLILMAALLLAPPLARAAYSPEIIKLAEALTSIETIQKDNNISLLVYILNGGATNTPEYASLLADQRLLKIVHEKIQAALISRLNASTPLALENTTLPMIPSNAADAYRLGQIAAQQYLQKGKSAQPDWLVQELQRQSEEYRQEYQREQARQRHQELYGPKSKSIPSVHW